MPIDPIQQLCGLLAGTDIGLLELRGPGLELRLRRDAGGNGALQAAPSAVEPVPARVAAPPPGLTVRAPSVGVFLHSHPLHDAVLAAVGARVRAAGQAPGHEPGATRWTPRHVRVEQR